MQHIPVNALPPLTLILAAISFAGVQFAKKHFPGICGRHALLLNAIVSTVLVLLAPPLPFDQVLTQATLYRVLCAIFAAGGIHGALKTMAAEEDGGPSRSAAPMLLFLMLPLLSGCRQVSAKVPQAAPALPVGAVDSFDAASNQVLQAAHAFAARITADSQASTVSLSLTQKTVMGRFNASLNMVDPLEIAYHACGLARRSDPTLPVCSTAALTEGITAVQKAFGDAEVAFAPTSAK